MSDRLQRFGPVKRNKTDSAGAEAICEAVGRPHMGSVTLLTWDKRLKKLEKSG